METKVLRIFERGGSVNIIPIESICDAKFTRTEDGIELKILRKDPYPFFDITNSIVTYHLADIDVNKASQSLCDAIEGKEPVKDEYMEEHLQVVKKDYLGYIHNSRVEIKKKSDEDLLKYYEGYKEQLLTDYENRGALGIWMDNVHIAGRVILEEMNERNLSAKPE